MNHQDSVESEPSFVRNPSLACMEEDVLYHIALGDKSHDLKEMFSDVKFVCFGGSPGRMQKFAFQLVDELKYKMTAGQTLCNVAGGSDRYVLYKVGPVISVSHGMGIPSLSILMHEILKLLHHAECSPSDVTFFRIGTSGGLGLEPGTVVISEAAVDGILRPYMEVATLGMIIQHPALLNQELNAELMAVAGEAEIKAVCGKTMCTYDFYEGQARLDGAFCDYTPEDKMAFLKRAHSRRVANIEMESLCFAAMTHRAGIKSAVLCVTLLDRLKGDQICTPHDIMEEWQQRPQRIVIKYIRKQLGLE
ncbi:uridine phosphorylase 2-like [Mizuhopecten yessoensis]|uniref:uridine phosphorylase 2-like n=1 Tax=Mizuhopecten yessoensis TaxID=6573 RepID=UPI000B45C7B0|nr:uridine phosphorylase 2-like [Mizuhopecten yessoensis]